MSKEKHKLEDIIRELRSLVKNHTRNGTERGKGLMVQLKRMGYTNVEISELSDGRWSTSTVKSHTIGVKTDNPGPKNRATKLLTELVGLNLRLDDVQETNNTAKSLRDKGLKLGDLLNFYKELQKYKINLKDLLNTYDKLQKTGIKIDKIKEILNYKTDLDKLGIDQESLRQIHEASKKFGKTIDILKAINTYRDLSDIEQKLYKLNNELDMKKETLEELKNHIADLNKEERKIKESLELYKRLESQGFTLEVLPQILGISKKYGDPKEVLKGLEKFGNLTNIQNEISKLNNEKRTVETDLEKLKMENVYLKNAIDMCRTLLDNYGYSISAIQTLEKVSEKYGGAYQVLQAIEEFETLKDLEKEIEEISTKKDGLESSISELNSQKESLRSKVDELTATAESTLTSTSEKFAAETEKIIKKFNDAMNNLSLETEVFQDNLKGAYSNSLNEIANKIPEALRNLGKLDEKIEKAENLALTLAIVENPVAIKEPAGKILSSALTYMKGLETYVKVNETRMAILRPLKSSISTIINQLTESVKDDLRS